MTIATIQVQMMNMTQRIDVQKKTHRKHKSIIERHIIHKYPIRMPILG